MPIINTNDLYDKFNKYIEEQCIVRSDVEVSMTDIIGQYRIWSKSASKETFLALQEYLKTRFTPARLKVQDKNQVVNGLKGVILHLCTFKTPI